MSVSDRVTAIIVEHLGVEPDKVVRDASFESLGGDSLDMLELQFAFEDEFGIDIDDDESVAADTVGKAIDLVESKLA